MSVRGATMVYLEDGSIDTLERLYREGVREFTSYALDSSGNAVKTNITDLRIDENQINKFYHLVFSRAYELVCDKWQKVLCNIDRSLQYVQAKDISDQNKLKCMQYYINGNTESEFINSDVLMTSLLIREGRCNEHTYTFTSPERNLLVPQEIICTDIPKPPIKFDRAFFLNTPTSIKFIAVHDGSLD